MWFLNCLPIAVYPVLSSSTTLVHGHECRQPVVMLDDAVGDGSCRNLARPAREHRHAERAFPVRILLAAKRRHAAIGPRVAMRSVVGRVHDERVLGDAQLIEIIEYVAHILVMVDHRVVVWRLPAAGLTQARWLGVRIQVHEREVQPDEERFARLVLTLDEVLRPCGELVVTGLHALGGERPGVLNLLLADTTPAWLLVRIVLVRCPRMENSPWAVALGEIGEVLCLRIVVHLRLFLRVEVIEVAEELVEAVYG